MDSRSCNEIEWFQRLLLHYRQKSCLQHFLWTRHISFSSWASPATWTDYLLLNEISRLVLQCWHQKIYCRLLPPPFLVQQHFCCTYFLLTLNWEYDVCSSSWQQKCCWTRQGGGNDLKLIPWCRHWRAKQARWAGGCPFWSGRADRTGDGPIPIHYWCTLFNANKGDLEPIPRKRLHLHRWKNFLNEEPSSYKIAQSHKRYRRTVTATLNVSIFISKIITATNNHFMWCHYNHKPWLECVWTKGTILSSKPSGVTLVVPKPMCTRHAFQICCRVAVAVHWSSSSYKFFLRRKNDRATEQRRRRQHSCQ